VAVKAVELTPLPVTQGLFDGAVPSQVVEAVPRDWRERSVSSHPFDKRVQSFQWVHERFNHGPNLVHWIQLRCREQSKSTIR
jgi:hypothetical protein